MKKWIALVVMACILTLAGCSTSKGDNKSTTSYVGTITDKTVKRYDDEDKYIIFVKLEDGTKTVFEDTDALMFAKFNSSDLYGEMELGKKYKFETFGIRSQAFSMYENIISVEEVK